MNRSSEFDERQLIARGKAFQYAFFAAMLCSLTVYLIQTLSPVKLSPAVVFMAHFWISILVFTVSAIVKDAFDGVKARYGVVVFPLFFLGGLIMGIIWVINAVNGKIEFVSDGMLTSDVSSIFEAIVFITVSIVYLIKQISNKSKYDEE